VIGDEGFGDEGVQRVRVESGHERTLETVFGTGAAPTRSR